MLRKITLIFLLCHGLALFSQKFEGLAPVPPMGWNSWNHFNCDGISEQVIMEVADAMVGSGLKEAGYQYIVIDDCWQVGRDTLGNIIADPEKFPSGIKALADYIHDRGLKFGIYSCAGTRTCQGRPGSRGYEFQDARTYASWGVDFLKYDWCNTGTQDAISSYTLMRDAIYKAGRPMVFSLCEWGLSKPWLWADRVGHLWRTTGDIRNNWDIPDAKEGKVWGGGVIINLDMQHQLDPFGGPDGWNDPDMLEIGNGELTEEEAKSQFSLWSMLAAPLMAGNDLRNMDPVTTEILTNREVIQIDQDPLGISAKKVIDDGEFEVYLKPLQEGALAVCFFNREDVGVDVEFDWKRLEIDPGYMIRDLWGQEFLGGTKNKLIKYIPAHGVFHLRLIPGNK
ncbi:MAG: glycoside hydrolase family 27 protein [Bacteroidota bacterium]